MLIGEIGDVAGTRGSNSGFHRCVGFLARLDALKEILHVVDGSITEAIFVENRILPSLQALAIHSEATAIELDRCLVAAEFEPSIVDGGTHHAFIHNIPARITERRLQRVGAVPLLKYVFVP